MTNYQLPITKFMKVEDLIDQLSQLPRGTEIHFEGYDDDETIELIEEMVSRGELSSSEINVKAEWDLLPLRDE